MASASSRLDALTGLRFVAAFAVVLLHSRDTFIPGRMIDGLPLMTAVSFFFVLSGFILVYVYPELPTRRDVVRFYTARLARIWPIHVFALLLLLPLLPRNLIGLDASLANIFLVHAWVPLREFFFSYNAVSWSVSTELGFYLLFPLLIYRFDSTWPLKLMAAAAVVAAAIATCVAFDFPNYDTSYSGVTNLGILYVNPLARGLEFVLGMCGALWWRKIRPYLGSGFAMWTLVEMAVIGVAVWYFIFLRDYLFHVVVDKSSFPVAIVWLMYVDLAPFFLLLIIVMAGGAGALARLMSTAPLVFLGEISYSVYMLHHVLILWYVNHLGFFSFVPDAIRFGVFVTVLLLLCAASYLAIERPARGYVAAAFLRLPRLRPA
jgi:peptidoglycan/LPS O-acetylase OafA/YrhL